MRNKDDNDQEMRLFAECSKCGAVSDTNAFDARQALFEMNDGTAIKSHRGAAR